MVPTLLTRRALAATGLASAKAWPADSILGMEIRLSGWIQSYVEGVTEQWLKVAPASNPAILDMFRDRDRLPLRMMVAWAGEFAGKYLTCAVEIYRMTGDPKLRAATAEFAAELISLQAPNGYLGPWPSDSQLTGKAPNCRGLTWDTWGHYHIMLGLLMWHDLTGDPDALTCVRRIADLLGAAFAEKRMVDIGNSDKNLAPIHSLCLLYKKTGEQRYLRQAEKIRDEFTATNVKGEAIAGDFINGPLAGKEFFELPMPRWESLHSVMAMAEFWHISGDERSREAFEKIWWSIAQWDRHNNGGFSSGEKAIGNPYDPRAIETCCTIAWIALSVDMLRLTSNSIVADEIELSTLNSVVGFHSPNGRWVTYNTPMDGVRKASAHDIVFQAREGSSELNCCSVNGARGFGMVADWAMMKTGDGLLLNWYGPGVFRVPLDGGRGRLSLTQETEYPRGNQVRIVVEAEKPAKLALGLRIPHWSRQTNVRVNSSEIAGVEAGRYLMLDRNWKTGDTIELEFDFSFQFWVGERECEGKVSIYRGPILLTYDRRFNYADPDQLPSLAATGLSGQVVKHAGRLPPLLLMQFTATDGSKLWLCDYASAGMGGSPYRSWLDVRDCTPTVFGKSNPRRSAPAI